MSAYQDAYKKVCAKLKEIESLRCSFCDGFGYTNQHVQHSRLAKGHPETHKCDACQGTGFGGMDQDPFK